MTNYKFGTDGIRGVIGQAPMTPDVLVRLGYAIGVVLGGAGNEVIIAKDTRLSGYMVESAIEAGLVAAGLDTALTGPLPTPAVAHLLAKEQSIAGIVISASHNPFQDNGIKIFDANGNKLTNEQEKQIQEIVNADNEITQWSSNPGKARRIDDATDQYVEFCVNSVSDLDLANKKIVIDAANGAAYSAAPATLRQLGATVHEFACEPDGKNINANCGALHPEFAANIVSKNKYDLGIVLDGDGDRVQLINQEGKILNGDVILFILATCMKQLNMNIKGVVGTIVSNYTLAEEINNLGLEFHRANVGDRSVSLALKEKQWNLGGESSGHILILDRHITGDGIIAALAVLELLAKAKLDLTEISNQFKPTPTGTYNIKIDNSSNNLQAELTPKIKDLEARDGIKQVLLRPSGTEPVLRFQVQAKTKKLVEEVISEIKQVT